MSESNKNSYLVFTGMAVQMGVAIGGGAWLGSYLDSRYQNETPIWSVVLSLVGVGASLYLLIRTANKMGKDD